MAFSVAGGTGAGIFYDYLHLIGHAFADSSLRVSIWPLVLMPSAFEWGQGGGRNADLNAGRALLDLFRLVDEQNVASQSGVLHGTGTAQRIDPEEIAVYYPATGRIEIRPGTIQTGILFSRPASAAREDMNRMIASFVMSMVGTEMAEADQPHERIFQSFADSFVNEAAHRQVRAGNGIGNRGVSTALFASLTVPVDELAGIISARLVRSAIEQLSVPSTKAESNRADIEEFLTRAGVHQVLARSSAAFAEPAPPPGAREVTAALNDRLEAMQVGIESLRTQLSQDVPRLAGSFHPQGAIDELLGKADIFHVQRIVFGHPDLLDDVDRTGAAGLLHRRRGTPPAPPEGATPPSVPESRDRFLRKAQWADAPTAKYRAQQDRWYTWASQMEWARAWDRYVPQWRRPLERAERDLTALTRELLKFARDDHEGFERRSAELYKKRVGVSYLLPPGFDRMDQFFEEVADRLRQYRHREGRLRVNASEPELLQTMVDPSVWRDMLRMSVEHGPNTAVSYLLEQVKTEVKIFLRQPPSGEQPMLPRLADLLAEAAGRDTYSGITQDYLDEFKGKLAGLLPPSFTPQGNGALKILVSYPADAGEPVIENYLKSSIQLPAGVHDFRNTYAESISVVLFRTGMSVTEVGEVRDVLRLWAAALAWPQPTDMLHWRQRTGYDFGYLATREEHRVKILHRMLCALWNGKGTVEGPPASPDDFSIDFGDGVTMPLPLTPLTPLGQASSWGSLLRAYELWALDDDEIRHLFYAQLMHELPAGLDTRPQPPHPLYLTIREMATDQIEFLDELMKMQTVGQRARAAQLRAFWAETLPAALDLAFSGVDAPATKNLRELESLLIGNIDG